ncbi:hypothetical protein ACFSC4_30535 [Deinococcus malanensis]
MATPKAKPAKTAPPSWALKLKMRRLELGKGQEDIVAQTGDLMTQAWVSDLERGKVELPNAGFAKVVALARALNWSLVEMQRATGVDLGVMDATLVAEGSADVYPLSAALNPDEPGPAVDHDAIAPGIKKPLLLRADTDEMQGTSAASIRPGSILHIDRMETTPVEGRVYVLTDRDGPHVRLYATTRLGPVFRAENRQYEDVPAAEAHIVGRVVSVATDYDPNLN